MLIRNEIGNVEFITSDDHRWISLLQDVDHDFYHHPCYAQVESDRYHGEALAFYYVSRSGVMLIPMVRRQIPERLYSGCHLSDAVTPYGYSGPIYTDDFSSEDMQRSLGVFIEQGRRHGFVTSFLRLHPLLNKKLVSSISVNDQMRLIQHGDTVSINLEYDIDFLDKTLRTNHKRDLKKLRQEGFVVKINNWDDFAAFQTIYASTMARLKALGYYYFNNLYFQRLKDSMEKYLHLCTVISPQGDIAAAGLFTKVGDIVQYHLGGTNEDYLKHAPSKLMFLEMRNWSKDNGAKRFHLGGGLSARRDSLFEFKRGFGTDEHGFYTLRIIHDQDAYTQLNSRFLAVNVRSTFHDPNYFPLYRTRLEVQQV
ncbi:MAG: GNAT family N-acetyltransferase [Pseudomonadota bacterium]